MIEVNESDRYQQFKNLLLSEAKNEEVGLAYFVAKKFYPEKRSGEIDEVVKQALLELLDDGLIFFYRADRHRGYGVKRDEVEPLGRAEIVEPLELGSWVDPPDGILFFKDTERGEAYLASLPTQQVPKLSEIL